MFFFVIYIIYMFSINVGECNNLLRYVPMEAMPGNKLFTIFAIISNNIVITHADIMLLMLLNITINSQILRTKDFQGRHLTLLLRYLIGLF